VSYRNAGPGLPSKSVVILSVYNVTRHEARYEHLPLGTVGHSYYCLWGNKHLVHEKTELCLSVADRVINNVIKLKIFVFLHVLLHRSFTVD